MASFNDKDRSLYLQLTILDGALDSCARRVPMTTDPINSLKIVKRTDGCVVCALYAFCDNKTENSSSRFTLPRYLDYFH